MILLWGWGRFGVIRTGVLLRVLFLDGSNTVGSSCQLKDTLIEADVVQGLRGLGKDQDS